MYCETCPVSDHCEAYREAEKDNCNSYHPQSVVRVSDYSEPACPLLNIVRKPESGRKKK